mgnify:FL=1
MSGPFSSKEEKLKDWNQLQADEDLILTKHMTKGRQGRRIDKIVLHHNGGNLTGKGCYDTWQTREASAHYQVAADGRITQLVWDADTAWHSGNWDANLTSIGIEHADCQTSPWRISDATLDNGAHLVAALCRYYKLGVPQWGVNVFPHKRFSSTECPASIAGTQNAEYMARAQRYYREMTGDTTPVKTPTASATVSTGLAVDGNVGPATVRRWQQVMGTTVDGIISGQLVPDLKTYWRPAIDSSVVRYGGTGSELIRAVQQRLCCGTDGLLGPNTIKAIQRHYGLTQDASFGPATARALQAALNANKF